MDFAGCVVLTGPTGSGKSALAIELAERYGCEIVSMDSMTIYRRLSIGTAKPTATERGRVPHHLIDVLEPWERGSVAWWLQRAQAAVQVIRARGRTPLFVGGTPFYLKAILHGLFDAPQFDPGVRAKLEAECAESGAVTLHARLKQVDAASAARLHANDTRRVIRALEVYESTGTPLSQLQTTWGSPSFTQNAGVAPVAPALRAVCLNWPREVLKERLAARVQAMLAAGWLDEVRLLDTLPHPPGKEAAQALGYAELRAHLLGACTLAEATEAIIVRTRQFAKRQLTWFRNIGSLEFVDLPASELNSIVWQKLTCAPG